MKEEALDRLMWKNRFGGALNLSSDRILNNDDDTQLLYYIGTDMCGPFLSKAARTDSFLLLIVFIVRFYGRNTVFGDKKDPIEQSRDRHPGCRLGECSVSRISFLLGARQNYAITI